MQLHLNEITKNVTIGYHAVIVMDKAGWHRSLELKIPKNITLVMLPPYSPEINPMEQVFQQLRKIKLSNTFYKDYEEINQACVEAWNTFVKKKENIKKLCLRPWANVY